MSKKNLFLDAKFEEEGEKLTNEEIDKVLCNRYDKEKVPKDIDVIIIGSGISGMSCGVFCARHGKRVLILEQFYRAGGCLVSFADKGYEFEVDDCSETTVNNVLFRYLSEGKVKFLNYGKTLDSIYVDDKVYKFQAGALFIENLIREFPKEKKKIEEFFKLAKKVNSEEWGIVALQIVPKYVRLMMKNFWAKTWQKYMKWSIDKLLHHFFDDGQLIRVLAYFATLLGEYEHVPAAVYLFVMFTYMKTGAYFPQGGSGSIPIHFARSLLKTNRGTILTQAKVKRILVNEKKKTTYGIQLENGDEIHAKHVISCCGIRNTYSYIPETFRPTLYKNLPTSCHFFFIFLGFDANWKDLGIPPSNMIIYDDIRKCKKWNEQSLDDVLKLKDEFKPPLIFIMNRNHVWSNDPNKSTLIVNIDCTYEWFKKWENLRLRNRGNDYEEIKDYFTDRTLEIIYKKFPKLKDHLEVCFSSTPLTVKYFLNYQNGEQYGVQQNQDRYLKYYDTFIKNCPIKNLHLCGQDAFFSHGITPSIYSSMFACEKIIGVPLFDKAEEAVKILKKRKKKQKLEIGEYRGMYHNEEYVISTIVKKGEIAIGSIQSLKFKDVQGLSRVEESAEVGYGLFKFTMVEKKIFMLHVVDGSVDEFEKDVMKKIKDTIQEVENEK